MNQFDNKVAKILENFNRKLAKYAHSEGMSDYLEDVTKIYVVKDQQNANQYLVKFYTTKRIPHDNIVCVISFGNLNVKVPDVNFQENVSLYLYDLINQLNHKLLMQHYIKDKVNKNE